MVVKKWLAAGIVALTVAAAAGVTSFAAEAAAARAAKYYTKSFSVGDYRAGYSEYATKADSGQAFIQITSGIPTGEAVTLTVINKAGYMASDSLYYNSYDLEHNSMYPVNYNRGEGIINNEYCLQAIYHRYYTYNPENLTLFPKWKP